MPLLEVSLLQISFVVDLPPWCSKRNPDDYETGESAEETDRGFLCFVLGGLLVFFIVLLLQQRS